MTRSVEVEATGPDFGSDAFLDTVADTPTPATFMGADSRLALPCAFSLIPPVISTRSRRHARRSSGSKPEAVTRRRFQDRPGHGPEFAGRKPAVVTVMPVTEEQQNFVAPSSSVQVGLPHPEAMSPGRPDGS